MGILFRCRSQIVSQALSDSLCILHEVTSPQSSSKVAASLEELHQVVASLQHSKDKATECVVRLEAMPGMLQSSPLGYIASEAEAQWLMRLVSGTSLPGIHPALPLAEGTALERGLQRWHRGVC